MTEAEWLACEDPKEMFDWLDQSRRARNRSPRLVRQLRQMVLDALKARATPRTLRLFGCACCRRFWQLLSFGQKAAVEAAEEYADHSSDGEVRLALDDRAVILRESLRACLTQSRSAWGWQTREGVSNRLTFAALGVLEAAHRFSPLEGVQALAEMATWSVVKDASSAAVATLEALRGAGMQAEQIAQCLLLRDVFGNPFRPVAFSPSWVTSPPVSSRPMGHPFL